MARALEAEVALPLPSRSDRTIVLPVRALYDLLERFACWRNGRNCGQFIGRAGNDLPEDVSACGGRCKSQGEAIVPDRKLFQNPVIRILSCRNSRAIVRQIPQRLDAALDYRVGDGVGNAEVGVAAAEDVAGHDQ